MKIRFPAVAQYSAKRGFEDVSAEGIHRSKTPYMAPYNGLSSLLHAVEALHDLGVSLQRARILPEIGRALEPETRLYRVEAYLNGVGLATYGSSPIRIAINVREDNRLRRFLPLIAVGLPDPEAIKAWSQGRAAPRGDVKKQLTPSSSLEERWAAMYRIGAGSAEKPPAPFSPMEGYHRFYLEPGAMPADWSYKITPAQRLALQLGGRFPQLKDPHGRPTQIGDLMVKVTDDGFVAHDNPLAGVIVDADDTLISQLGTVQELIEVFLTHAMLTIAGADAIGGFEFVIPVEPPEGWEIARALNKVNSAFGAPFEEAQARAIALVLNQASSARDVAAWFRERNTRWPRRLYHRPDGQYYNRQGKRRCREGERPDSDDCVDGQDCEEDRRDAAVERAADDVAKWFNAYPHRTAATVQEQYDPRLTLDADPQPTYWSGNDPGIRKATERIANWYRNGSVQTKSWDRDSGALKYKLPQEPLEADDMLSVARAYLPDFLPDYPKQACVSGGMNLEGVLLGMISKWLDEKTVFKDGTIRDGTFLGMDYSDWALFPLDHQAILCGLLVQRGRLTDQCAVFEAALRLLIDEGIKTWLEQFRTEKIGLDREDRPSPLAQLGFCMPLGGMASIHAPSLKIRIPRDYTRDPEATTIDLKLRILESLFLPAHIPVQHIWEYDWVKLGETAYLKAIINPVNPDLIPIAVRLYGGDD